MKYIKKGKEPVEFTEWKTEDKMYQHDLPNWNRLKSSLREVIKESLVVEQGGICCYCERELLENDSHLEHIKPIQIPRITIRIHKFALLLSIRIEKNGAKSLCDE